MSKEVAAVKALVLIFLSFLFSSAANSEGSASCAECSLPEQNELLIPAIHELWKASQKTVNPVCPPAGHPLVPIASFKLDGHQPSGALITHARSFAAVDSCDAPIQSKSPQSLESYLKKGGDPGVHWDLMINGGFVGWADAQETIAAETVAPVVHQGKLISLGNGNKKAWFRGAVAELTDGRIVICKIQKAPHSMRARGWKDIDYLRDACGLPSGPHRSGPDIKEFEGGGGLFLSHGKEVRDLYSETGQNCNRTLLLRSDLILAAQKADGSVDFITWYGLNTDPLVSATELCAAGYESAVAFDNSSGFYRRSRVPAVGDWTAGERVWVLQLKEKRSEK